MFPQSSCAFQAVGGAEAEGTASAATGGCYPCGPAKGSKGAGLRQCSSCGTTCASGSSICPRCGSAMTNLS